MAGRLFELMGLIDALHDGYHPGMQWVIRRDNDGMFRIVDKAHGRFYLRDCIHEVLKFFGEYWCDDDQWQLVDRPFVAS